MLSRSGDRMLAPMDLTAEEGRVLGCLVEKQLATPQYYPLTLKALTAGCNQASNRDPVVAYDEGTVESAVSALKDKGLVRFVHPSHGRSATRYRQVLDEVMGLEAEQLAVLAMLLLRGPQTPGELRARTERMWAFAQTEEVERHLAALAERDDALVMRLAREPGRREARYTHRLGAEPASASEVREAPGGDQPSIHALADEVGALRAEVVALRHDLDEVMKRLDLKVFFPGG